jgi:hypothetical protein
MPVMAVTNQNQHQQTGDYRSRPPDPEGGLSGSTSGSGGMIRLARHLSKKPGAVQ